MSKAPQKLKSAAPTTPRQLNWGDYAPWFRGAALSGSNDYMFDTVAGRHVLILLFGSAGVAEAQSALRLVADNRALFDDAGACFFGVTVDPEDAASRGLAQQLPGIRFFLDYDRRISTLYGAAGDDEKYHPHWLVLDPALRVLGRFELQAGGEAIALLRNRLAADAPPLTAPVLVVPNVFEPELCRRLIALYEADGGEESGFMQDRDGKTRLTLDPLHKVRRDYLIEDPALSREINLRIIHRLLPMVRRAFSFEATRVERLLVGCYEAETGGHFRAHRDNTTKGTAHRRFAVTINLNAEDYEGGDLRFPEFGPRSYRAATGGAIVFSCSLLHEAQPVTKGRRFAFLPFLYDEAGAVLRERNAGFLEGDAAGYRADQDVKVG
jgi:predicted 2-oxoglutarate/Fe(II)-dependent dioxygenase YbiX/peroxiredoxin